MSLRARIRERLAKPTLWLYVGSMLIVLDACIRIFALLGPPLLLHLIAARRGAPLIQSYKEILTLYFQQAAPVLGYTTTQFYWIFGAALIFWVIVLLVTIFLFQRRRFARLIIVILFSCMAGEMIIRAAWNIRLMDTSGFINLLLSLLWYGTILLIFTKASVANLFGPPKLHASQ